MDGRWLLLAFGVLFGALTVAFVDQGKALQALVAGVQAVTSLGVLWWYTVHDERLTTRFSRTP